MTTRASKLPISEFCNFAQIRALALLLLVSIIFNVLAVSVTAAAPVPIEIGIRLSQLVDVDQKKENFTAVITVKAKWNDPLLRHDDGDDDSVSVILNDAQFQSLVLEKGTTYPAAIVSNQQAKHSSQRSVITVYEDGTVEYLDRASITVHASQFNFKRYPFDTQLFIIHLDSLLPESKFVYKLLEDFSGIDETIGADEWIILDSFSEIKRTTEVIEEGGSRIAFSFYAKRHYIYYILKIFIPVFIIILVSWFTFFLRDYRFRIDMAAAGLLLFIVFNYTVANDLPRLNYLTFLDAFLVMTFVLSSVVIFVNVLFKRLENMEKTELVDKLDNFSIWMYPIIYLVGISLSGLLLL